jgi:hypothetical protein
MKLLASVSMVVLLVLCAASAGAAGLDFQSITVNANQSNYNGSCPDQIVFTAWVTVVAPEDGDVFNHQWTRSDGATGPTVVHRLHRGINRVEIKETWSLGATGNHYNVWEELHVNSGNTHLNQRSRELNVTCR